MAKQPENPLQMMEQAFQSEISRLEGRLSQVENILSAKSLRAGSETVVLKKAKDKNLTIELHFLHSDQRLRGKVRWVDTYTLCVKTEDEGELVIPKHSILYWKIREQEGEES